MPITCRGSGAGGPRSSGLNSRALAVSPPRAAPAQAVNSSQRSYTACGSAAKVPPLASATSRPWRSSVSRVSRPDTLAIRISALQNDREWGLSIFRPRVPASAARSTRPAAEPARPGPRGQVTPARGPGRAGLLPPGAPVLQLVAQLRGLGLGQVLGHLFARVVRERVQVRLLRPGHRLVAGGPVLRVLLHWSVTHRGPLSNIRFRLPIF